MTRKKLPRRRIHIKRKTQVLKNQKIQKLWEREIPMTLWSAVPQYLMLLCKLQAAKHHRQKLRCTVSNEIYLGSKKFNCFYIKINKILTYNFLRFPAQRETGEKNNRQEEQSKGTGTAGNRYQTSGCVEPGGKVINLN